MRRLIAFTFLAMIGCGEKQSGSVKLIDLGAVDEVSSDLLIEKAILLGADSTALLSEYMKVMYDDNGFFVMDYDRPIGIHHFSRLGEHLGLLAKIGEAPGEIAGISEFRLIGNELKVISGMGNSLELHTFLKSGELSNTTPFPLNAFTFYPVDKNKLWFYSGYNMVAGDHRLVLADSHGVVRKELLPNDFNEMMLPVQEQSFFKGDDAVLFRESFKTRVYQISEQDSLKELYRFDFGAYTVPAKFWEMDPFEGFEMISKQGFSDINFMEENERYMIVNVVTQKERESNIELYIWDKSSNKEFKIVLDEELGYFNSIIGIEENYLVFIAYAPYLVRNNESLNLSSEAKTALRNLSENSNPVILYAKIPN